MKKLISIAMVLCASWYAPAFAAAPSQGGSKVLVPPLISKAGTKIARATIVRLPSQAGKVSKIVPTTLVAKGPSWIAKGDKYYSLCVPNRKMVACAPIMPAGLMKGIEVGADVGTKGEPLITFKLSSSGLTPKRTAYLMNHFLGRTKKLVAHFNRMSVSYAPTSQSSLRAGPASNYRDSGGGNCSYEDVGIYDCSGGDSGGGDNGGGWPDPIPEIPIGQCDGNCDYPDGDNGDPCIAPDGRRICNSEGEIPQVPVNGERETPDPMSLPGCRIVGPGSVICGSLPPGVGGIPDDIPRAQPWFSQSWCNAVHFFCTMGQEPEPDNDRGPDSSTSGKSMNELYDQCDLIAETELDQCSANRAGGGGMDNRMYAACKSKVETRRSACYTTARELTDNGSKKAP